MIINLLSILLGFLKKMMNFKSIMMLHKGLLSILIVFLTLHSNGQETLQSIKNADELRVGLTASQPPYSMMAKDSSIIGFEVDIAQEFADKMGVKLVPVQMNFAELLPALKKGEIDLIMSGMTMTTERNMEVAFIGPYHTSGKSILTFVEIYANAESPGELNKKSVKIAVLKGSTSEDYVNKYIPKAKLTTTDNYEEAIELLNNDKVGLLLAGNAIIRYTMFRNPDSGFSSLEEPFNYEPIGVGVMPNDILLINLLQNLISEMDENGTLEGLENDWFWDDAWLEDIN
jgi:polar amino acid transport system substrate-binding protein